MEEKQIFNYLLPLVVRVFFIIVNYKRKHSKERHSLFSFSYRRLSVVLFLLFKLLYNSYCSEIIKLELTHVEYLLALTYKTLLLSHFCNWCCICSFSGSAQQNWQIRMSVSWSDSLCSDQCFFYSSVLVFCKVILVARYVMCWVLTFEKAD